VRTGTDSGEEKEKKKGVRLAPLDTSTRIIDDLNRRASTKYKPGSKARGLIHARMADGATEADFMEVHRKMTKAWAGDAKMAKYLRPSTLYGSKFDEYLGQLEGAKANPDGFDCNANPWL